MTEKMGVSESERERERESWEIMEGEDDGRKERRRWR